MPVGLASQTSSRGVLAVVAATGAPAACAAIEYRAADTAGRVAGDLIVISGNVQRHCPEHSQAKRRPTPLGDCYRSNID